MIVSLNIIQCHFIAYKGGGILPDTAERRAIIGALVGMMAVAVLYVAAFYGWAIVQALRFARK